MRLEGRMPSGRYRKRDRTIRHEKEVAGEEVGIQLREESLPQGNLDSAIKFTRQPREPKQPAGDAQAMK